MEHIMELLPLVLLGGGLLSLIVFATGFGGNLNHIKAKTAGDGQHGTARFASAKEIRQTYRHVPFTPDLWRSKPALRPKAQGIVVGCTIFGKKVTALIDDGDVHALMIGASGVGKTAF